MNKEIMKRFAKNCMPWRLRYFVKLQEAKGNIRLPNSIKQYREIEEYNNSFYKTLKTLKKEILLEIADFANVDSPANINDLKLEQGYMQYRRLPELGEQETWRSYLSKVNAVYSINGLEGYKSIPDGSVDYVFSFAVFEHIRKNIFVDTMKEVYRFMKTAGIAYHTIDFTDHLGGGKNHLRFPDSVWEDKSHYNMDNYTNRISCTRMCKILEDIGFEVEKVIRTKMFKRNPIQRKYISPDIGYISDEDLNTAMATLILRK